MTTEEQYWSDKAALLDPACYVFVHGQSWERVVPTGKVWYLLNAWALRYADTNYKWHHRNLDEPLQLPQGFILKANNEYGYAYYADPSLVQSDPRYQSDPKGLYYERVSRLRSIPLEKVNVHIPVGVLSGDPLAQAYNRQPLPEDATKLLVRFVDCHDGCWVVFCREDFSNAMNTQNELDDVRPMRSTKTMLLPIIRDNHTHVALGFASITGNPSQPQTYNGWGTVMYQRLPGDW